MTERSGDRCMGRIRLTPCNVVDDELSLTFVALNSECKEVLWSLWTFCHSEPNVMFSH